jgi:hypothetical protein
MTVSDWRKVPGYGQRGVDILADLEATEECVRLLAAELADANGIAQANIARAEKAEAERAALAAALRKVIDWRGLDGDGISDPLRADVAELLAKDETKGGDGI